MLYFHIKFLKLCSIVSFCDGRQGSECGKVKGRNTMQCVITVIPNSMVKLLASCALWD